jgi:HAD superfamily hydrolase (TIGR01484 family)
MSHKISLVLTDIDGTLVPVLSKQPTKAVADLVKKVQDAGIEIVAATGRPYEMAKSVFVHIGLRDFGIFDGGATIRRLDSGELVWNNWLSVPRLKEIIEILQPVSTVMDFFPICKQVDSSTISVNDVISDAPYVFAFVKDEYESEVLKKLEELENLNVHLHYAHDDWKGLLNIQITDKSADKFHAVQALKKLMHIEDNEVLAIGDSENDMPLFKCAKVKVAMGNATQELKDLADYIVADVDNDGFVEAMNRFVLEDNI